MPRSATGSIESRRSWQAAFLTVAIFSISFGSPLLAVVGLRDMQAAMHTERSVVAMASALVWIGNGIGGIPMGWLADRIGIRKTVSIGTVSMAAGLALSSTGTVWALYVGHGLLIGLMGNGAIYAPLMVHVSRWFDRRRGTAIALISSGQYIAGMVWPSLLEVGMKQFGWQAVHAGLCRGRTGDPAIAVAVAAGSRTAGVGFRSTGFPLRRPRAWLAPKRGDGADLRRELLLLHADGIYRLSSCCVLWAMSGLHQATARRCYR